MTDALRERFGKYHVLDKIAQGGMAEVYKVKTVGIAGFEKVQALKRILPHSAREGRFIRSFIDEARIAVELTHRNIVQVFDFGKADGELFLAMELIEGKDLRTALGQAVARELLPSIPIAAYIVAEVAAGLDYAHRKTDGYGGSLGIVHCDVSPSNVMLSSDGYVKILDFGIARASFASALERRRLRGKPRYMAPEQTLGEPPTPAADVFALGIIAWELFTGQPLFHGPDLKAILEAVRRVDAPRIDRINPAVPPGIAAAVATALDRDPLRRGSVGDLLGACARIALQAGARTLAAWLAELDRRPDAAVVAWAPDVTSISVPRDDDSDEQPTAHAAPQLERSVTQSLSGARFLAELDAGPARGDAEASSARILPARTEVGATAPWPSEHTLTGAGAPDFGEDDAAEPSSTEPFVRPSYSTFTSLTALTAVNALSRNSQVSFGPSRPSTTRVDDEATAHGAAALEDTRDDAIGDAMAAPGPGAIATEEPIDDDLGAMATGVPGERRRTVVVAGVVAGAPRDQLRLLARSLGELAYQRGGVVLGLDDDALVVAFGLEVAGEDDVAVAMGWSLDASAMVRDAGGEHADAAGLQVGAVTGVATQVGYDGAPRIPEDAIELARALAREAPPDRPMFAGGAGRLTSALYALREVPAPPRIRHSRLLEVLEVVGPRGFDERDRARLERRGRFIGRTAQLAELDGWLDRAIATRRRCAVLIRGAAGTGKSRLVAELLARRAAGGAARVVTSAASPASHLAPFAQVIDVYQGALGLPPSRGRAARAQVAQRLVHRMVAAGTAAETARAIATDLDRAMELRDGVGVGAPEVADLRPRIAAGLAAFRAALADPARPLITVLEDIHLADRASLEVLRHLLAVPASGAELVVLTARPDERVVLPAVGAEIEIGDLVGGELRALIADRLGAAATPLQIAAVLARGGGNPLYIEELVEAVRDAGPRGDEVPASAHDVVSARLDRLTDKARAALRLAAVLGARVRTRLLEELLGEQSLDAELDELVEAGFLVRPAHAAGAGASEGELQFARDLVREVVYDALPPQVRRDSHARVGRLLASRFFAGREEPPASIAEHLELGGETAGAAAFWLRAGRLALAASDAAAAASWFSRSLRLERELGAEPTSATSRARRREAIAGRDDALRLRGELPEEPGDLDELEQLCAGEPARLAEVAIRRAHRLLRTAEHARAIQATAAAEERAIAAGDDPLRGEALRLRGEILDQLGRFDEALAALATAGELFHRRGATEDALAAQAVRARVHLQRAHAASAREAHRPIAAWIERTGDPGLERLITGDAARAELQLGAFERAMRTAERALELARRYGDRAREGDARAIAGAILAEVGRLDDAAAAFAEALDLLSRTASRWSRAGWLVRAGACEVRRTGAPGIALIDEALAEARRMGARSLEARALVARSAAQLRCSAPAAAIEQATEAAAAARTAGLVAIEIEALVYHGLALTRLGDRAAGPLIQRALGLYDQQRSLESAEEEILSACAEVLRAAGTSGAAALADQVEDRARRSARHKAEALSDPAWRAAYLALPEIRDLLAR